jgi:ectoine hydroxylase-related dioxygenase (phytanoyl-CoA dioxygenase family)
MSSINEFYQENGYYIARGVYAPEEVRELEVDFDRIVRQLQSGTEDANARWGGAAMEKAKGTVVVHTHNVQRFSAAWLRALLQPKFLEASQAILGPNVILHHTKLFQKPAEKGAPFPMHQDWSYFPTVLNTMMAGIIHVSRADDQMGCFRVFPGSHKLGRIKDSWGQDDTAHFAARFPLEKSVALEAQPGDVVFFHYCLVHGSKPNTSNTTRKTVLVQMHSGEDEVEDHNRHPNERLTLSGWNSQMTRGQAGELS